MWTQTPHRKTLHPCVVQRAPLFGLASCFRRTWDVPGTRSPHSPEVAGTGLYVQMKNLSHREVSVLPEVTQLRGDQAACIYVPDSKTNVFFYGVSDVLGKEL